jgi:hypothetical protein
MFVLKTNALHSGIRGLRMRTTLSYRVAFVTGIYLTLTDSNWRQWGKPWTICQVGRPVDLESNLGIPECEPGVLIFAPLRLVFGYWVGGYLVTHRVGTVPGPYWLTAEQRQSCFALTRELVQWLISFVTSIRYNTNTRVINFLLTASRLHCRLPLCFTPVSHREALPAQCVTSHQTPMHWSMTTRNTISTCSAGGLVQRDPTGGPRAISSPRPLVTTLSLCY